VPWKKGIKAHEADKADSERRFKRLCKERRLVTESNLMQLNRNKKSTNKEKMFYRTNALADSKSSSSSLCRQKKVLVAFSQATNGVATERWTL